MKEHIKNILEDRQLSFPSDIEGFQNTISLLCINISNYLRHREIDRDLYGDRMYPPKMLEYVYYLEAKNGEALLGYSNLVILGSTHSPSLFWLSSSFVRYSEIGINHKTFAPVCIERPWEKVSEVWFTEASQASSSGQKYVEYYNSHGMGDEISIVDEASFKSGLGFFTANVARGLKL